MHDVTVTSEAVSNIHKMVEDVEKKRVMFGVLLAGGRLSETDALDKAIEGLDAAWALLHSLNTALEMARQVPNGRIYADLDGLEFIGSMHGGIVNHGNGDIRVHT